MCRRRGKGGGWPNKRCDRGRGGSKVVNSQQGISVRIAGVQNNQFIKTLNGEKESDKKEKKNKRGKKRERISAEANRNGFFVFTKTGRRRRVVRAMGMTGCSAATWRKPTRCVQAGSSCALGAGCPAPSVRKMAKIISACRFAPLVENVGCRRPAMKWKPVFAGAARAHGRAIKETGPGIANG